MPRRILREVEQALASGEQGAVGALLRREGLFSSLISSWRAARDRGELAGLAPKKRGRKASKNRILAAAGEVREPRDQLATRTKAKPELLATAPNQVWSWDISKLKGPVKWTYFYLYVVLDIFSRYAVGWMVASRESATLGQDLIRTAAECQGIEPGQLIVHADRGSPMIAKSTALLYADLGIGKPQPPPRF